jgi:hypothetical protein
MSPEIRSYVATTSADIASRWLGLLARSLETAPLPDEAEERAYCRQRAAEAMGRAADAMQIEGVALAAAAQALALRFDLVDAETAGAWSATWSELSARARA